MRAQRRTLIALLCLSPAFAFAAPSAPKNGSAAPATPAPSAVTTAPVVTTALVVTLQVAVSPFANSGSDKTADYIGFQAAEFFSSALPGFPGVQVVERTQLMKILSEQELQLSGVTDEKGSVSVGKILNARQILVGSFELSKDRLALNGRLVDVESGAVLSRAMVETSRSDSYSGAYKAFLIKLLSGVPSYAPTIGVEARIETMQAQSGGAADDYAKALAALYRKDDEAALSYLQNAIGGTQVGFVGYSAAADRYLETLARVKGSSRYAKMVQRQVETNKALMDQVEPLSLYRATLKITAERAAAILSADAFAVQGDPASAVQFDDGTVSTKVRLPASVAVGATEEAKRRLAALLASQNAATLGPRGLLLAKPKDGKLLSAASLSGGFDFAVRAEAAVSVKFLDTKKRVVYELESAPAPVMALSSGELRYAGSVPASYKAVAPKDGWALHADGTLEIQARALADLDTVSYSVKAETLRVASTFPFASDLRWKSLIAHAYRKYSIKVASGTEDPTPQFKDVVLTDSFFTTADPALGRVPMLPREGKIASFADPWCVVYCADSVKDAVSVSWQGRVAGTSKPFVGDLGPETVLYFEPDKWTASDSSPLQSCSVQLGTAQASKTVSVSLDSGKGWISERIAKGRWSTFLSGGGFLFSDEKVYSAATGAVAAKLPRGCRPLYWDGSALVMIINDGFAVKFDPKTESVSESVKSSIGRYFRSMSAIGDRLLVRENQGILECYNARTLSQLWTYRSGDEGGFIMQSGGKLFLPNGAVLDLQTGKELYYTGGRGFLAIAGDNVVWANGVCVEAKSGTVKWTAKTRWRAAPTYRDGVVYFGGGEAFSAKDGSLIWQGGMEGRGSNSVIYGDTLFAWERNRLSAIDPRTGSVNWSCPAGGWPIIDGSIYAEANERFVRYDLSVLGDSIASGSK